jgi:hypothetical protein
LPVEISLQWLTAMHARWVTLLESLGDEDFRKGYIHPSAGGRQNLALGAGPLRLAQPPPHRAHRESAPADGLVIAYAFRCRRIREEKRRHPAALAGMVDRVCGGASCSRRSGRRARALRYAPAALLGRRVPRPLRAAALERGAQSGALRRQRAASRGLPAADDTENGRAKPVALELVPNADRRTPTAREASRRQYLRQLERVLQRAFPDWKADGLRAATDLEHSFGPAYARGHLLRGTAAEAVIGVGADESSAMVDGVLTLGLLWLDYCREHSLSKRGSGVRHYGGLKVIVPRNAWRTTAERMAWLNHSTAKFQLFALDERSEELTEIDFRSAGNVESRLVHAFDVAASLARARSGVDQVLALIPLAARRQVELRARSAVEVGLHLHGLEFARVRIGGFRHLLCARGGNHLWRRSERNRA